MKILLTLALLSATAYAQQPACPLGTRPSGGLGTSGCMWEVGCYTSKQIEEGFKFIAKCMCGETGMSWGGGTLQYSRTNKWENDTCVTKERWERRLGGKWVEVTEVEYNKLLEVKPKRKTKRRRQR